MKREQVAKVGRTLIGAAALAMIQSCGNASEPTQADGSAHASAVAPDVKIYEAAARKLTTELGEPGSKSTLPGPNDPAFSQFSDQAVALTSALGTEQYPVSVQTFDMICAPATRVMLSYELVGAGDALPRGASEAETQQALARLSTRNMSKYFDQLFPLMVFGAHCLAVHLPEVERFTKNLSPAQLTDVRRGGVKQVRDGLFNSVSGLLIVASDPGLDEPRRIKVLRTLAGDGKLMVPSLSLNGRAKLIDTLNGFRGTLRGDAKTFGDALAGELRSQECNVICSM